MVMKDIVDQSVCLWHEEWIAKYHVLALYNRVMLNDDKEDSIYAAEFWDKVKLKAGIQIANMEWNDIVKKVSCINWRIFRDDKRSTDELFGIFEETIRMRLMSLKAKHSANVLKVQQRWNINICAFHQSDNEGIDMDVQNLST
ncbi:hypothetical protein Tco_1384971 [Tanacetum coccineum]